MPSPNASNGERPTLYLIDGHAQIFRAFYAIRSDMTSSVTGEPTNAVFAFTGMLLKFIDQCRPQYVAMPIDSPGPTHRDAIYDQYKANRQAPPEELEQQIPRILEITRLFGIPVIAHQGAEADDLIATITDRLMSDPDNEHLNVRLISKDKDLEQLLGERVTMFDVPTDTVIDTDTLMRDKGITPEQVADVLALTGDSVDNIPGVPGIGPKTAVKLIQQFGSVEGVLENLDQIKGKRRENLEASAEFLPTAKRLVTLDRDVPIEFDPADARLGAIDAAALRHVFKELGFNRHQRELERLLQQGRAEEQGAIENDRSHVGEFPATLFDAGASARAAGSETPTTPVAYADASGCSYRAVTTRQQLDELVRTLGKQKLVAVDVETIGLGHRTDICGLCFAWEHGGGVYVPVASPAPERHLDRDTVLEALRGVLEDENVAKCGHNIKYDLLVLRHAGVRLRGIVFDSMIGAHLLEKPGQGLDDLALAELRHEAIPITNLIGERGRGRKQKTMDQIPLEQITPYAAEDADLSLRLCEKLRPQLKTLGMAELADNVEMPLIEVLADMEWRGIRVDPAVLDEQKAKLKKRIVTLRDQVHEAAGEPFNIDSPRQLADVLFNRLKLPVHKRTKTGPSTDIEVLERLCDHEDLDDHQRLVPQLMVEYRQLTKLVGTYLEALKSSINPTTARVHATFHQTGTATGRLSSSDPNLQNIPVRTDIGRQIRRAFIADPGQLLICADYAQIELRILAHLADDRDLIETFQRNVDIHAAVAAEVFDVPLDSVSSEQRNYAKVINFGIVYGVTPWGLARRIEGLDVDGAKTLIENYRKRFKGIDRFLEKCIEHAQTHGHVETMLGRRRSIPQINARTAQGRALGERLAINTVVQGSAADLIKQSMVNLHHRIERERLPIHLLLQIHDELVVETPQEKAEAAGEVLRQEMENAMSLKVPLTVELGTGHDWLTAK